MEKAEKYGGIAAGNAGMWDRVEGGVMAAYTRGKWWWQKMSVVEVGRGKP